MNYELLCCWGEMRNDLDNRNVHDLAWLGSCRLLGNKPIAGLADYCRRVNMSVDGRSVTG